MRRSRIEPSESHSKPAWRAHHPAAAIPARIKSQIHPLRVTTPRRRSRPAPRTRRRSSKYRVHRLQVTRCNHSEADPTVSRTRPASMTTSSSTGGQDLSRDCSRRARAKPESSRRSISRRSSGRSTSVDGAASGPALTRPAHDERGWRSARATGRWLEQKQARQHQAVPRAAERPCRDLPTEAPRLRTSGRRADPLPRVPTEPRTVATDLAPSPHPYPGRWIESPPVGDHGSDRAERARLDPDPA